MSLRIWVNDGVVAFAAHAAQHDSFETSRVKICAASLKPSLIVRYGAQVLATSELANLARLSVRR